MPVQRVTKRNVWPAVVISLSLPVAGVACRCSALRCNLIGLQQFQVEIPGLADIVRDLIVGALVAGGVYQVPNRQ